MPDQPLRRSGRPSAKSIRVSQSPASVRSPDRLIIPWWTKGSPRNPRRSHGGLAVRIVRTDCLIHVCSLSRFSLSKVDRPFSATHFLRRCFGLIPTSCSFADSASRFRPYTIGFPPIKHPLALGAAASRFWVPQENGARKRRNIHVLPICYVE